MRKYISKPSEFKISIKSAVLLITLLISYSGQQVPITVGEVILGNGYACSGDVEFGGASSNGPLMCFLRFNIQVNGGEIVKSTSTVNQVACESGGIKCAVIKNFHADIYFYTATLSGSTVVEGNKFMSYYAGTDKKYNFYSPSWIKGTNYLLVGHQFGWAGIDSTNMNSFVNFNSSTTKEDSHYIYHIPDTDTLAAKKQESADIKIFSLSTWTNVRTISGGDVDFFNLAFFTVPQALRDKFLVSAQVNIKTFDMSNSDAIADQKSLNGDNPFSMVSFPEGNSLILMAERINIYQVATNGLLTLLYQSTKQKNYRNTFWYEKDSEMWLAIEEGIYPMSFTNTGYCHPNCASGCAQSFIPKKGAGCTACAGSEVNGICVNTALPNPAGGKVTSFSLGGTSTSVTLTPTDVPKPPSTTNTPQKKKMKGGDIFAIVFFCVLLVGGLILWWWCHKTGRCKECCKGGGRGRRRTVSHNNHSTSKGGSRIAPSRPYHPPEPEPRIAPSRPYNPPEPEPRVIHQRPPHNPQPAPQTPPEKKKRVIDKKGNNDGGFDFNFSLGLELNIEGDGEINHHYNNPNPNPNNFNNNNNIPPPMGQRPQQIPQRPPHNNNNNIPPPMGQRPQQVPQRPPHNNNNNIPPPINRPPMGQVPHDPGMVPLPPMGQTPQNDHGMIPRPPMGQAPQNEYGMIPRPPPNI